MRLFQAARISLVAAIFSTSAQAQFSYVNIAAAEPSQGMSLFPAINGDGTVAFVFSPALGDVRVLAANGGAPTLIADLQGSLFSISSVSPPSINAASTVAFSTVTPPDGSGQVIYTGDGGPLTAIADTTGILQTFFGIPAINAVGTVAFGAYRRDGSEALYTGSAGDPLTTIAQTGSMFSSFHNNGGPSINAAGTVAFNADRGGGNGLAIFTSSKGVISTVAQSMDDGTFTVIEGRPAINSGGTVAFLAFFRDGEQSRLGVFTGDSSGVAPTLIVAANVSGTPAINEAGTVAYNAILEGGNEAIYTKAGAEEPAIEVIRTGDPLFDSTVTLLGLSTYGLNDSGQIAFGATLADGRIVIARADP